MEAEKSRRTALLDALDGGIGNGSVDGLCGILDGLGGRLLEARVGAEKASVAEDGLAVHCGGMCVFCEGIRVDECCFEKLKFKVDKKQKDAGELLVSRSFWSCFPYDGIGGGCFTMT